METENQKRSFSEKIKEKLDTGALQSFFMGKWYPIAVAVLVLAGHTFGLEVYLCFLNMLLFTLGIIVCDSLRPLIIAMCSFTYQVSMQNTPGGPVWSDTYTTGINPYIIALISAVIVADLVYIIIKFKVFSGLSFSKTPLLLSMCILGVAFLLNGLFSPYWQFKDLLYGALQAFLFPFIFLLFYKGLKSEKSMEDLGIYVSYVAAVMGVILALEMAYLYCCGGGYYPTIFDDTGAVIKERIHLGWATWNPAGACISILIPAIFYGVMKGRYPALYFGAATLTYFAALLTLSRNAMIFATLAYFGSVLIACFFAEKTRRTFFRVCVFLGILGAAFFVIVFFSEIKILARAVFEKGLSDNGRFGVWAVAINNFKSAPVFGTGFYHFTAPILHNLSPAIPLMAHQTFLQLLSSMGVVGLAAYLYYRFDTLEMFIKKPTLLKTMLGFSALTLLLGSLLDNFIFIIFPTFFYGVVLAVSAIIYERQNEEQRLAASVSRKSKKTKSVSERKRK